MPDALQIDIPLANKTGALYRIPMQQNAPDLSGLCAPPMDKEDIRAAMISWRKSLAPDNREHLSHAAAVHVLQSSAWKNAETVALYMAMPSEINARALADAAWQDGKTVLLPLCSKKVKGEMQFIPCPGPHSLRPGPFGILEPVPALCGDACPSAVPDLVIVPGVVFALNGTRIGMGGGYYDRLFAQPLYSATRRIGFCYNFQIVPSLPREPWDIPMHALCTEKGITWIPQ